MGELLSRSEQIKKDLKVHSDMELNNQSFDNRTKNIKSKLI
jgi:hypothetical protein